MMFALALRLRAARHDSMAARALGMALDWYSQLPPQASARIEEWVSLSNVFCPQYYAGQFETTRKIYELVLHDDSIACRPTLHWVPSRRAPAIWRRRYGKTDGWQIIPTAAEPSQPTPGPGSHSCWGIAIGRSSCCIWRWTKGSAG
jgi:hypothetical protein